MTLIGTGMAAKEFLEKLVAAQYGEHIVYHTGYLAYDRKDNPELHALAWMVLQSAGWREIQEGYTMTYALKARAKCYLVQRKIGFKNYEYIAVKRREL